MKTSVTVSVAIESQQPKKLVWSNDTRASILGYARSTAEDMWFPLGTYQTNVAVGDNIMLLNLDTKKFTGPYTVLRTCSRAKLEAVYGEFSTPGCPILWDSFINLLRA